MATLPNVKTVTYEEWLTMPEIQDAIEEVVNGEIRIMPPAKSTHARIVQRLNRVLDRQLDAERFLLLSSTFGLVIRKRPLTSRVPDLAVFQIDTIVEENGYFHSAPQLAVEVLSPANTRRKSAEKPADYSEIGIPEVWVVSHEARTVEVLCLENGQYTRAHFLGTGDILKPRLFPDVQVNIAENLARLMIRIAAAFLLAAGSLAAQSDAIPDLDARMRSFISALAIASQNAAEPIDTERAFFAGAIPRLLSRLDPHSVFFDRDQFEQLKRMETSTQKGFGSVVSILPGRVIVLQTLPGTPSAKSGLAPGDEILAINGYIIGQLDIEQLPQLLEQSRRRPARLDVRRPGVTILLTFTLTPEELQSPSVDRAFFLAAGVGYVRMSSFEEKTPQQLKEAIEKLGGDHLAGLVLDLRNNPGGLVTAAIGTSSLFLQPGAKIVTVRGRHVPEKSEFVPATATPYGFKLAILMNEKSASASEIVSGAMQDHDRATILGAPSFGKGLVQSVYPLSENTGLALTTALYYTPSGRSIQKPLDAARFELGSATAHPNTQGEFRTDKGRVVTGGGGIRPDIEVYPAAINRLRAVLDASASFTNFATEYLRTRKVDPDFEIAPQLLDEFRTFLSERQIRPNISEWFAEREFVSNRLKTELFNQAFGVEKGDEVEAQRDPVILKALEVVGS